MVVSAIGCDHMRPVCLKALIDISWSVMVESDVSPPDGCAGVMPAALEAMAVRESNDMAVRIFVIGGGEESCLGIESEMQRYGK